MKGYFLFWQREPSAFTPSNGVFKKVQAQCAVLGKYLGSCELKFFPTDHPVSTLKAFFMLPKAFAFNRFDYRNVDYLYIRRPIPLALPFLFGLLKKCKKVNVNAKILFEVPTFPYDDEETSFIAKIFTKIDTHYRNKLHRFVDRVVTFSADEKIFGIPTIRIVNGVDCTSIPPCAKKHFDKKEIHIIAVANFAPWHGFDRFLYGMAEYYKKVPEAKVIFHIVGSGTGQDEAFYKKIVAENDLSDFVIFHGAKGGEELTEIFDKCDVALCSLGSHRKGIHLSSDLKSREYVSRALPIVSSSKIDVVPDGWKYCMYVPEDESPIDVGGVVNFALGLYADGKREAVAKEIRAFAEQHCDMSITMQNVIEYINGKAN